MGLICDAKGTCAYVFRQGLHGCPDAETCPGYLEPKDINIAKAEISERMMFGPNMMKERKRDCE